jgi:hypothetical protein
MKLFNPISTFSIVGSCSDEVDAAFANYDTYGDGLTEAEEVAMETYICAEFQSGNYQLRKYQVILSLSGNNALVDFIGGKVATPVNTPTFSVAGMATNGTTNYLNTGYAPATDGGIAGNEAWGFLLTTSGTNAGTRCAMGVAENGDETVRTASQMLTFGNTGFRLDVQGVADYFVHNGFMELDVLYTSSILDDTSSPAHLPIEGRSVYIDGIIVPDETATTYIRYQVPTGEVYIGAKNEDEVVGLHYEATYGSVFFSEAIGMNNVAANTNLKALLTTLGTI